MRRARSGQRRKVEEARRVVQQALGDTPRPEPLPLSAKYVPTARPMETVQVKSQAVLVLTIGEVAARLDISRADVQRMIASGKMRGLETGWTVIVPTSEVHRFRSLAQ